MANPMVNFPVQGWDKGGQYLGSSLYHTQVINGQVVQVQDHVLYDTLRCIIGTTLPAGTQRQLFQVPVFGTTTPFNTTTTFAKTFTDTNMEGTGALPQGYWMEIHSIQAVVNVALALDTTPLGTGTAINGTRSTDASAENQLLAYMQSVYLSFGIDNRVYERGLLQHFPSDFTPNGNGFSGATTVIGGTMGNGFAGRRLSMPHVLMPLQRFNVTLQAQATITNVQQVLLQVALVGRLFTPVG